jgi:predicted Fe-S protein YdhL (DUF1289 family)
MDRQCSSCGGFCKKAGCERENTKTKEWVGLTDAEVEEVFFDMGQFAKIDLKTFARAIEAKLKEKNT